MEGPIVQMLLAILQDPTADDIVKFLRCNAVIDKYKEKLMDHLCEDTAPPSMSMKDEGCEPDNSGEFIHMVSEYV
jgi:hypothetical protein